MVALVPGHQMGIEMGVILLIFTGQVWNLAFSFYSSLKSIPREMMEATRIYRYSALAALLAAGDALRRDRAGVELDCLGGRRLVRPDLLRDLYHGRSQLPVARTGELYPDGHLCRRRPRAAERDRGGGPDRGGDRPACMAAADRLERQIQIRAGRVGGTRDVADPGAAAQVGPFQFASRADFCAAGRAHLPAPGAEQGMPRCAAAGQG